LRIAQRLIPGVRVQRRGFTFWNYSGALAACCVRAAAAGDRISQWLIT
jgi:hypothetical protein